VAFMAGRTFVLPEDVQSVFVGVTGHRLVTGGENLRSRDELAVQILRSTAVD
jgi:MoxR-like ATPase